MLTRILEPEVMDSAEDAHEYDAMDHAAVNASFVTDLLAALGDDKDVQILDLGAGTALIPIELCRRAPRTRLTAVDAAESMLKLARINVAAAGLADRIDLVLADAKHLPFAAGTFSAVISNSIVHHLPEPRAAIAEAVRLTAPGGLMFYRDLARPHDEAQLEHIVATYAGNASAYQRKLFADSLCAALTLEEVQQLVAEFGFPPDTVRMTSDRHWTWSARRPAEPGHRKSIRARTMLLAVAIAAVIGFTVLEIVKLRDAREQFEYTWNNWQNFRVTVENVVLASESLMAAEAASPWISEREVERRHIERLNELLADIESPTAKSGPEERALHAEFVRRQIEKLRPPSPDAQQR